MAQPARQTCDLNMSAKCLLKQAAKELGLMTYMNWKPCRNGHIAPRRTYNGNCTICNRIHTASASKKNVNKRNEYARKWRSENPDKVAIVNKRKYEKNKASSLACCHNRRARKIQAMPPWIKNKDITLFIRNRPIWC